MVHTPSDTATSPTEQAGGGGDGLEDELDMLEFLGEMWVTTGIALPVCLFIISMVSALIGEGLWMVWLSPASLVVVTGLQLFIMAHTLDHPARRLPTASAEEKSRIKSTLNMITAVTATGVVISITVLYILDIAFLSKITTQLHEAEASTELALSTGDAALMAFALDTTIVAYVIMGALFILVTRGILFTSYRG